MPYEGQSRVIPWADYSDGRWWEMTPVIDHDQPTDRAVNAARTWARRNQLTIEVKLPPPHRRRFAPWRFRFVPREGADHAEAGA